MKTKLKINEEIFFEGIKNHNAIFKPKLLNHNNKLRAKTVSLIFPFWIKLVKQKQLYAKTTSYYPLEKEELNMKI